MVFDKLKLYEVVLLVVLVVDIKNKIFFFVFFDIL